jgi:prophage maintenance system killer protein
MGNLRAKSSNGKEKVFIYQAKDGAIELRGDFSRETVWATQAQISELFDIHRTVVARHIRNIFKDQEIEEESNVHFLHVANSDKRVVAYSLDVILAIGYRTNSRVATHFRQWATKTLRRYIVDGYVVNKKVIAKNYAQFLNVVEDVKKLLPAGSIVNPKDAVELVSLYADTWLSLEAYDKELLLKGKLTRKKVDLTAEKVTTGLSQLKSELVNKSEATEIFGVEREPGAVAGIVGNVLQSFDGRELYESAEEKAAHLLYFMVKDHPFTDGNKRSGAFSFIWFLKQANILDVTKITPSALTALTILVASSDPKDKDKIVSLILNITGKR